MYEDMWPVHREIESSPLAEQWRQTQRRMFDNYVYTNDKDDQVRQHQPNKKLQLNNKAEWNTYLVRVGGPTPVRSTRTINDNGVREELDLMCLEDYKYLKAFEYDIQRVHSRHVLSLGPGSSRYVRDYCRHRSNTEADRRRNNQNGGFYLDKAINCDSASTSTDPYGRIHAYYPDAKNYKREEAEFRQRILQNPANVTLPRILHLRDTTSNFMCSLGTGLQTTIHLRDEEDNYTRILCITSMAHSQLVKGLMTHFPYFVGVRLLKNTERAYAIWKADELRIARILLVKCIPAYEVVFSSSQCGLAFCTKFANTPAFDTVMKYPVGLDDCSTPTRKEYYSLVLKWYPYPSEQKVDIYLKNPEDMGYAEQILNGHHLPFKIPDSVRYHPENRKMVGKFHKYPGNTGFDSHIAEKVLTQILSNNGIDLDRVFLYRNRYNRPFNDQHIRDRIHMRIGRAAFNAKVWNDSEYLPELDQEWFVYIQGNEKRLGWELELKPSKKGASYQTKDYQRKATVTFDNAHVGEEVAEYMMERTPNRDTFVLAERDNQGVHFFPIYTVRFECPRPIRTVCDAALNSIDESARAESDYEMKHWVRVRDFKHEDVLVVEGWPMEDVIAVAAQVKAVLRGRVVKCVEDNTDTSPGRLLYGCGLQHVNHLQNTHQRKVSMTLDRLHQEITMWGDEATMDIIEAELYNYANDRGSYTIEAQIIIESPRFLPIFREVLVFNTIQRISQAIGGAAVRFKPPHFLMFSGSVKQYEDLQKLLDHTHQRALDIVGKNGYGNDVVQVISTDCVVCLTEAVGPFSLELCGHTYCLQCIAQRIRTSVEMKEVPITCCADGCNKLIALEDILNLMFDENSIKYPHFWNEKLQSMLKVCSEQAVIARRDMMFCTKPDCSAVIKLTEKRPDEIYECSRCQMQMCAGCFNPPHPGRTCTAEAALRDSVDLSLQEWVKTGRGENEVKRCPTANCRAVIEKDRGCNHMQCQMCKVHFCWLCCFTADTDKAIYAHMGDHHGGTGGEWAFLDQHQGPEEAFNAPPGFEHIVNRANVVFIDGQPVVLEEE